MYRFRSRFRYSLNGKPGYASGGSTMNSTRSMSTNSDHYAIVHSRPGSRYSGTGKHQPHMQRGPPSNMGSHYSGKLWTSKRVLRIYGFYCFSRIIIVYFRRTVNRMIFARFGNKIFTCLAIVQCVYYTINYYNMYVYYT